MRWRCWPAARTIDALARELDGSRPYRCDVTDPDSVAAAFSAIRAELGDPEVLIYNAGSGVWGDVTEISRDDFERSWRVDAAGALDVSHEVIPAMRQADAARSCLSARPPRCAAGPVARPSRPPRPPSAASLSPWRGGSGPRASTSRWSSSTGSSIFRARAPGCPTSRTVLPQARRRCDDGFPARPAAPIRMVVRSRCATVRREVVARRNQSDLNQKIGSGRRRELNAGTALQLGLSIPSGGIMKMHSLLKVAVLCLGSLATVSAAEAMPALSQFAAPATVSVGGAQLDKARGRQSACGAAQAGLHRAAPVHRVIRRTTIIR